mmetsp:Transcript_13147/g.22567  ORF Transcript_13147/g.22567 Transcript_13147/m.22567 type:complete len:227 (-) Transcript_13147:53-733(-)
MGMQGGMGRGGGQMTPGGLGAFWGRGPPPMTAQSILPKGLPPVPANARKELMKQYKKIPKFDDLDESGLESWNLPNVPGLENINSGGSFGKSGGGSFGKDSYGLNNSGRGGGGGGGGAGRMRGGASQRRGSFRGGMPGRNMNRGGGGDSRPGREPPAHYGPTDKALPDGVICRAKAKYAYTANNDDEHTFNAGDIFEVLSKDSANWWTARYNGVTALLPANYCEEI